jgi:hypothetical protein
LTVFNDQGLFLKVICQFRQNIPWDKLQNAGIFTYRANRFKNYITRELSQVARLKF